MSMNERLTEILATMEVPPVRLSDWGWLMRNLAIQNQDHPDFAEAMTLIKKEAGARRSWH